MIDPLSFRCPPAARWLGRALAASVLVGAALLSNRIYGGVDGSAWSNVRPLVVVFGALLALVIVRSGARLRGVFSLTADAVQVAQGKHRLELPYEQIESLTYDPPLVSRREWVPALVLIDRFGKRWRVPAMLERGTHFVVELIRATGRDDLRSFASAHDLEARMGRTRSRLVWGYGLSALIVLVCLWISLGGPDA